MASERSVRVFELFENTVFENTLCSRTQCSRTRVREKGGPVFECSDAYVKGIGNMLNVFTLVATSSEIPWGGALHSDVYERPHQ